MISDFFSVSLMWNVWNIALFFFPCFLWHSHVNCLRHPKYLVTFFYVYEEEETNPSKRHGSSFSESSTQRVKTLIDTFSKSFGLDLVLLKLKFKTCIRKLKWFDVKWAIFFVFRLQPLTMYLIIANKEPRNKCAQCPFSANTDGTCKRIQFVDFQLFYVKWWNLQFSAVVSFPSQKTIQFVCLGPHKCTVLCSGR